MSVDFSQFFNGPIRDSLIAQVSGYLDISRQQATTAYDKAVALVIGAMARQAGKPEGAQELTAHIQNSQTQTSLTSSALSPTVLTNDQFAQIVTLGESEQAVILGPQQEAVTSHLEVATGLDSKAVGSLLSIVVPFVLSFLKNNITTESAPAQSLPVLLATQAPHVATQLDAPALAALGEESLEGLFGSDALAAAHASAAATLPNGRQGAAEGATAKEKPANGWFKWVLTLAVVLAGAAWVKSCTQSDTANTENAKPADQQQSATDAPATDGVMPPAATPENPQVDTSSAATGSDGSKATEPDAATEPSANFPAPDSNPSAAGEGAQTESADQPATSTAPASTAGAETVPPAGEQSEREQSQSANGKTDASATDSAPSDGAATSAPESAADTAAGGPTYGQASDSMEPDAQSDATSATANTGAASSSAETAGQKAAPSAISKDNGQEAGADSSKSDQEPAPAAEGAAATTAAPDRAATDNSAADNAASGKTTTFAEPAPIAGQTDTPPAAATTEPADTVGKTTTFAAADSSGSQAGSAQPKEGEAEQPADTQTASGSDGNGQSSATTASPGKTTTFGVTQQDDSASTSASQAESAATTTDNAGQPPVATEPTADSAQARVQLERDGDTLRIRGTVPDELARNRILNAAKFIDGHSKIEDELKVDDQVAAPTFDDYSGLLSLLRGYHDVNVSLGQQLLTLTGQVSSNAEKEALTAKVQNLVGTNIQVDNQAAVKVSANAAAPDAAVESAALPRVQFASGSSQVDDRFHDALDQYALQLKESGKSVRLIGFADESGNEPGNEALSKRRAESVKAYLILRGVQAQQIQTEGQGTQAPVADNTTEAGRAKNRRVEVQEQ